MKSWALVLLALSLCFAVWVGLAVGTSSVDFGALGLSNPFILNLRLPRVVLGALSGAGLAVAGVTFQALLRNPLADPYVVGVSGGAALGGVLALVLGIQLAWAVPLFAFGGAVVSVVGLFVLAQARQKNDPLTLLLIGVIFNSFAAAVVTFFKAVVTPQKAQEILYWLMGVLGVESWTTLAALGVYVGLGIGVIGVGAGALNLLSMGDDDAQSLGLPVARARFLFFCAASLLVGSVVAVAGMIAFVGLVVPHALRRLIGADHRWLVPASALGGAAFLVLADTLARATFLVFGTEIPVGVITAFSGGPFFLLILLWR